MRVTGPGSTSQTSSTKKKGKGEKADGSFGSLLSDASVTAPAAASSSSPVMPVSAIDSLLSLQMVNEESPKKQIIQHGNTLLDYLDELRHDMLLGFMKAETANKIIQEIKESRGEITDPQLKDIITDIEVRAAVELAKLGK